MPLPRVFLREDRFNSWLEVEGVGLISHSEADDLIGPIEIVRQAGLASLRRALVRWAGAMSPPPREFGHPETGETIMFPSTLSPYRTQVQLVKATPAKSSARRTYEFMPEPMSLVIREGGTLAVEVQFTTEGEDEPDERRLRTLLAPLLRRNRAAVDGVHLDPQGAVEFRTTRFVTTPDFWVVSVYLTVPVHGRDAGSAIDIGYEALLILDAADGAPLLRTQPARLSRPATPLAGRST